MPDDAPPADAAAPAAPQEGFAVKVLTKLWKYHPAVLSAVAAALALTAYAFLPTREDPTLKTLAFYVDESVLPALRLAENPLRAADNEQVWQDVIRARSDVDYIFGNSPYREQLETDPALVNPYLLYAETYFLYGNQPHTAQDRAATFARAVWAYQRAIAWENREWNEREQKIYDHQFFAPDEEYDEQTLRARQALRREYLNYKLARAALETGELNLAEARLNEILPNAAAAPLPPRDFEMLPEDRVNLRFYLAQVGEKRGDLEAAERNYRIFLLNARRSAEYFRALTQLGNFSFRAAERVVKTDPEAARRLFYDAGTIFSRVIADSPPGDILRAAYFVGGQALYNMALTIPVGETTYWDKTAAAGTALATALEDFSGSPLPPRALVLPAAAARLLGAAGLTALDPLNLYALGGGGSLAALSTKHRLTRHGERQRLLQRAADFFIGSQGGTEKLYDGAASVMLARIAMARGDFADGRKMLARTTRNFASPVIDEVCKFDEAVSYLREGELDRAFVRFAGGPEKTDSSLLIPDDIKSYPQFCVDLLDGLSLPPPQAAMQIWSLLPVELQGVARATSISKIFPERYVQILIKHLNAALGRENFYNPENFGKLELPAAARRLLAGDPTLLTLRDREWLNRMCFDAACRGTVLPTGENGVLPPFTAAAALPKTELLTAEMVRGAVRELADAYLQIADTPLAPAPPDEDEASLRLRAAVPRRALMRICQLNDYLLKNYPDPATTSATLYANARLLERGTSLAAAAPFRDFARARELLNKSGATFMEVRAVGLLDDAEIGSEALRAAGRNYFAAGNYGQASEALAAFTRVGAKSDQIGWASNLLGRCYWYLGRYLDAIRVYRENALRRTPDGYESLYYLGAVYFDVRTTRDDHDDKLMVDRLGDPAVPYPAVNIDGRMETPQTALQVFNEIRRQSGLEPTSRPWRWATFGLGKVWYEIAERTRRTEEDAARAENRRVSAAQYLSYYANAEKILREGLDRYRLASDPSNPGDFGIRRDREPEDYDDARRQRLENEYYLALTLREINAERLDGDETEMRKLFDDILDGTLYPPPVFSPPGNGALLLQGDALLGVTGGPMVRPRYLETLRRNAFFLLAQSYRQLAKKFGRTTTDQLTRANQALEEALAVYRRARDVLPPADSPQIYYHIGDTLFDLQQYENAGRMFLLVVNQVDQMSTVEKSPDVLAEIRLWRELAQNRLLDMENLHLTTE
ncbi:hypothetical protein AGMMS49959_02990 [Planctomycetales bacterium]|nr:hypothetical protein AGMMS49959_02990 [Planctomycetales bacterium]